MFIRRNGAWFSAALLLAIVLAAPASYAATTYPQPYITSVSPNSGGPGTVVTISGSGFAGANAASVGNAHDAGLSVVSDGQVRVTVPADATTGAIGIFNPQRAAFTPSAFTVTSGTPTTASFKITSFAPSSGPVGTVVTLNGVGFTGSYKAYVGTAKDAKVQIVSDTQARVTMPADAVSGRIRLLNRERSTLTSGSFTVGTGGTPPAYSQQTITGFTPTSGTAGDTVTVTGSGFMGTNAAWVGNGHNSGITIVSDTQMKVTVPADASTGPITVFNPSYSKSSSGNFTMKAPPAAGTLAIRVKGNQLVDASGKVVQLRGVNLSGLEFVPIQGWSPSNPWGGQTGDATPNFQAIKTWKSNVVRLPLNQASWLGTTTIDDNGASRNPDPGGNYRQTVIKAVADATAAGFYVIVDLHWSEPGKFSPNAQNSMADADHSLTFWTSVANTFKANPAVIFELFNEPYFYYIDAGADEWNVWRNGGHQNQYNLQYGPKDYSWQSAGMQQMLDTVRATGASNVVLVGGKDYALQMDGWLAHKPSDPLNQMAAAWHAYPNQVRPNEPTYGTVQYTYVKNILAAGIPVVITETGDHNAPGTQGSPLVSAVLPWADSVGASYLAWAWDVWQNPDNTLLKDASGTPTDGYGVYYRQHLLDRAGP